MLLLYVLTLLAGICHATVTLSASKGAMCSYVNAAGSKQAAITLSGSKDAVPALIFRYIDILNFTSIPTVELWTADYDNKDVLYAGVVDTAANQFVLNSYRNRPVDKVYNGYVGPEHDVEYPLTQSGMYCVYVAVPSESSASIAVSFNQGHGRLSYFHYVFYNQAKWCTVVGSGLFAYLFYYILRFKTGSKNSLDSISLISKSVIFFVLLPFTLLAFVEVLIGFVENRLGTSGFFSMINVTYVLINAIFSTLVRFFILLFAMGYGVIYYHEGGSRNYRVLPAGFFRKASILLIVNVVAVGFLVLGSSIVPPQNTSGASTEDPLSALFMGYAVGPSPSTGEYILAAVSLFTGVLGFVWTVATIYYYRQTRKTISSFPPSADDNANEKIIKSYKRSVLVIFVLPLVIVLIGVSFTMHKALSKPWDDRFEFTETRSEISLSALQMFMNENTFAAPSLNSLFITSNLSFFITVLLLFAIWIKDNNGLIVEKNPNYDGQFDVESEDEMTI